MKIVGTDTEDKIRVLPRHEFVFPFIPDRAGLYTFQFYVARSDGDRPRPGGGASVWVE